MRGPIFHLRNYSLFIDDNKHRIPITTDKLGKLDVIYKMNPIKALFLKNWTSSFRILKC